MRRLGQYIISIVLLFLMIACNSMPTESSMDDVTLTLRLAADDGATRGNVTDNPNNAATWSEAEKLVDGRFLYTVSVYIVDKDNLIVASRENIVVQNQAEQVVVDFDETYNLTRGMYRVLAVANNADYNIGGDTYNTGLSSDWKSGTFDALMNNKISTSSDNVSPKDVVQPLSMMKEVELHAGNNHIEGELVRTFARIRIEVSNNSGVVPLKINNLTFSNNFTQQSAYVFDDGTDRKYFTPKAAIKSTSTHALQPFMKDDGATSKTIPVQESAVVFDGYLLESKAAAGENYTYTLDMKYENAPQIMYNYVCTDNDVINSVNSLGNSITGGNEYYLIYNTNYRRYLSADANNNVGPVILNDFNSIGTDNIWQVTKEGDKYYIKNLEKGLYIQTVSNNSSIALGANRVAFSFENQGSYIALKSNRYIGLEQGRFSSYSVKGYSNYNSNNCRFYLYKVTKQATAQGDKISTSYNSPIILTTIDPISQQASPTTEIKRNDFINILVTVSYNPAAGEFEFKVEDWNVGGGNVEFN